ncbi:OsmC family protein [Dyella sp.]|uniref:OsmC family protein n=1 Tax=Dyella sp. TaxID=1869338 RepID=UPI002ED206A7
MGKNLHNYSIGVRWTGNRGEGTRGYTSYGRDHEIRAEGKPVLAGSADPAYRGDASRYNPEDMLVASLSTCHMLWYLHLASDAGIVVTAYEDDAVGTLDTSTAKGHFTQVLLRPRVTIAAGDAQQAAALHHDAHEACYVANSMNFPVRCEPRILT